MLLWLIKDFFTLPSLPNLSLVFIPSSGCWCEHRTLLFLSRQHFTISASSLILLSLTPSLLGWVVLYLFSLWSHPWNCCNTNSEWHTESEAQPEQISLPCLSAYIFFFSLKFSCLSESTRNQILVLDLLFSPLPLCPAPFMSVFPQEKSHPQGISEFPVLFLVSVNSLLPQIAWYP